MSEQSKLFWAGGSPPGWCVYFHREPNYVPGKTEEVTVKWFSSVDYGSEMAAENCGRHEHSAQALQRVLERGHVARGRQKSELH